MIEYIKEDAKQIFGYEYREEAIDEIKHMLGGIKDAIEEIDEQVVPHLNYLYDSPDEDDSNIYNEFAVWRTHTMIHLTMKLLQEVESNFDDKSAIHPAYDESNDFNYIISRFKWFNVMLEFIIEMAIKMKIFRMAELDREIATHKHNVNKEGHPESAKELSSGAIQILSNMKKVLERVGLDELHESVQDIMKNQIKTVEPLWFGQEEAQAG